MGLDRTGQHVEAKQTVVRNVIDPRHSGVGIIVTNDRVAAHRRFEPLANVGGTSPQPVIIGHVHEVDSDVAGVGHEILLGLRKATPEMVGRDWGWQRRSTDPAGRWSSH